MVVCKATRAHTHTQQHTQELYLSLLLSCACVSDDDGVSDGDGVRCHTRIYKTLIVINRLPGPNCICLLNTLSKHVLIEYLLTAHSALQKHVLLHTILKYAKYNYNIESPKI